MKLPRKQRSISATGLEWDAIRGIADDLGVPVSKLIIERVLGTTDDLHPQPRHPDSRQNPFPDRTALRETLGEILLLAAIARDNMEARGQQDRLEAITKRVTARLDLWGL